MRLYYVFSSEPNEIFKEYKEKFPNISRKIIYEIFISIEDGLNNNQISQKFNIKSELINIVFEKYNALILKKKGDIISRFKTLGFDFSDEIMKATSLSELAKLKLKLRIKIKKGPQKERKKAFEIEQKLVERTILMNKKYSESFLNQEKSERSWFYYDISKIVPHLKNKDNFKEDFNEFCDLVEDGQPYEEIIKNEKFKDFIKESYFYIKYNHIRKKVFLYRMMCNHEYAIYLSSKEDIEKMFKIKDSHDLEKYIYETFYLREYTIEDIYEKSEETLNEKIDFFIEKTKEIAFLGLLSDDITEGLGLFFEYQENEEGRKSYYKHYNLLKGTSDRIFEGQIERFEDESLSEDERKIREASANFKKFFERSGINIMLTEKNFLHFLIYHINKNLGFYPVTRKIKFLEEGVLKESLTFTQEVQILMTFNILITGNPLKPLGKKNLLNITNYSLSEFDKKRYRAKKLTEAHLNKRKEFIDSGLINEDLNINLNVAIDRMSAYNNKTNI